MEKLKKVEAHSRAQAAFGSCAQLTRSQHVAYGLARGIPYAVMERCSNDAPPWHSITRALAQLGVWPEVTVPKDQPFWAFRPPKACSDEVEALVVWVRKTPRGKRPRPSRGAPVKPVAEAG